METVLITGGSGLIGTKLILLLEGEGYVVKTLTRNKQSSKPNTYHWDVDLNEIDVAALEDVDHVIHLAGTGIADKRWTKSRKREIYESRINSATLLRTALANTGNKLKSFIGTSAIGYYGDRGDEWLDESSDSGRGFLAKVCIDWEEQSLKFEPVSERVVILRFGVVLTKNGGALQEMEKGIKPGIAAYLGNGQQYVSWIHIDDLCQIILQGLKSNMTQGVYNAVAPEPVSNKGLIRSIAKAKKLPAMMIPTPGFALKLALGELSSVILGSQRCSSKKIEELGFNFRYAEIEQALADLYG